MLQSFPAESGLQSEAMAAAGLAAMGKRFLC